MFLSRTNLYLATGLCIPIDFARGDNLSQCQFCLVEDPWVGRVQAEPERIDATRVRRD
jgi:hypothetical protein